MNHFRPLLAEVSSFVDSVSGERNVLTSGISQISIIIGAIAAIVLILFVGTIVFRKQLLRRKRRHHHHHRRKSDGVVSDRNGFDSAPPAEIKKHGKRRRMRRKRHSRNPTLAETRGLPPNRQEQSASQPPS